MRPICLKSDCMAGLLWIFHLADPALAANCLSEGRKWAKLEHSSNVESRRGEAPDLVEWSSQRDYDFLSIVAGRYVSVKRTDSISFGQMVGIDTILWDKKADRRISIRPFFRETENGGATLNAIQTAIIDLVMARINAEDDVADKERETYRQRVAPNLLKIGPVSLAPATDASRSSGLIFHYGFYFVGSRSDGVFDAFVPWEKLKPQDITQ